MSSTPVKQKVNALMWLAAGKSQRAAAEAAEVSPGTVATWRKDTVFAAELEAVTALYRRKPLDGRVLLDRLEEAEQRLSSRRAGGVGNGCFVTTVSVPAGASPARRRRIFERGVAKGIAAAIGDPS